jgi:hypothetical protein
MMTEEQVDVFARGLYHVAGVDGVDPSEMKLIKGFLKDAGHPEIEKTLEGSSFHVAELAGLETSFLKRVFLKACLVLIRGDGKITDAEKDIVRQISAYLELDDDFEALDAEAAKEKF